VDFSEACPIDGILDELGIPTDNDNFAYGFRLFERRQRMFKNGAVSELSKQLIETDALAAAGGDDDGA